MGTKERFGQLIAQISVNYRKQLSEADIANFKLMLDRFGIDNFEHGVHAHMFDPDQGHFFPNISCITKHVLGTEKQNALLLQDKAELSWNVIMGEISRIGSYGTLKLDDGQALAAVQAIGGWRNLCAMSMDKLTWAKKEFLSAYGSYERTPVELLPNNLPGRIAIQNQKIKQSEQGLSLKSVLEKISLNKDQGNGDS